MTLVLILMTLWLTLCFSAFSLGYYLGKKTKKQAEAVELTEYEKRALEKEKRELKNFWTYNGEAQK